METYVVRVWLPDRPGALGQVASRIGAVHGDVIGIDILERGGGSAIDELTVTLPESRLVDLMIGEIRQVDGVAVEDVRWIAAERPDAGTAALGLAADLVEAEPGGRLPLFCDGLRALVDGDWCAVVALDGRSGVIATAGNPPDLGWLHAFVIGSRHLDVGSDQAPSDIVWTYVDGVGVAVASGRRGRPFHARERQQVALLGRLADALPAAPGADVDHRRHNATEGFSVEA